MKKGSKITVTTGVKTLFSLWVKIAAILFNHYRKKTVFLCRLYFEYPWFLIYAANLFWGYHTFMEIVRRSGLKIITLYVTVIGGIHH